MHKRNKIDRCNVMDLCIKVKTFLSYNFIRLRRASWSTTNLQPLLYFYMTPSCTEHHQVKFPSTAKNKSSQHSKQLPIQAEKQ